MFQLAKTADGKIAVKIDDQPPTVVEPVEFAGAAMALCAHLGVDVAGIARDLTEIAEELKARPVVVPSETS
jgi:hypothetical protein